MNITVSDFITAFSVLLSVIAIVTAIYSYRGTLRAASRPVLIFSMSTQFRWQVQNVGTGPAINLIIADCHINGSVDTATNCYPVAAGAILELIWLKVGGELVAVYTDIFGTSFTTVCNGNQTRIIRNDRYLKVQPDSDQWLQQILAEGREHSTLRISDIEGKCKWDLDIMRNEPYARHGYIFKRQDLQNYFTHQPWYNPTTDDQGKVYREMTSAEKYDSHFILVYQRKNGMLI